MIPVCYRSFLEVPPRHLRESHGDEAVLGPAHRLTAVKRLTLALLAISLATPARAQVLSWSRAVTASTTLTFGLRLEPHAARQLDKWFRPLSPYRDARRPNGAYLLPDARLFAHTCDVQHLH